LNPHAEAQVPKTCVSAISPLPHLLLECGAKITV
jgi:hypothetical protein